MKDYSQGKIYTIRCKINPEYVYVGSTIRSLNERLSKHKYNLKKHQQTKSH